MYFKQDTFFIAELRGTFVPFAPLKAKSLKKKSLIFTIQMLRRGEKGNLILKTKVQISIWGSEKLQFLCLSRFSCTHVLYIKLFLLVKIDSKVCWG